MVIRDQNEVEVKSMMLVLVKNYMLRYVEDVRSVRGMGRALSNYYVVLCEFMLVVA